MMIDNQLKLNNLTGYTYNGEPVRSHSCMHCVNTISLHDLDGMKILLTECGQCGYAIRPA